MKHVGREKTTTSTTTATLDGGEGHWEVKTLMDIIILLFILLYASVLHAYIK